MLGGILQKQEVGRRSTNSIQSRLAEVRPQIEAYEKVCNEIGNKPAIVALAWLLQRPAVTAPIIGPRTVEQLNESIEALDVTLSEETMKKLDEIFPGPGGAAPEAYAW